MNSIILFCAFRYALGRKSYIVSCVVQQIHRNWENMPDWEKIAFVNEILERKSEHGDAGLGDPCDQREWMGIVERFNRDSNIDSQ